MIDLRYNQQLLCTQIYCPIDEVPGAFHRVIYLFCCKSRQCLNMGSVKCFRMQLPRINQYYSYEPADADATEAASAVPAAQQKKAIQLCVLCG